MIFNYKRKLEKYRECMNFLNENSYDANKIYNLVRYFRENNLLSDTHNVLGELQGIVDFYKQDLIKSMDAEKNEIDPKLKKDYCEKAQADLGIIKLLCVGEELNPLYQKIYSTITRMERLSEQIKDEDRIPLSKGEIKNSR